MLSEPDRGENSLQRMLWQNWTWIQKPVELPQVLALIDRVISKSSHELDGASNNISDFLDSKRSSYLIDLRNRNRSYN
jgi:hypothetical protein